jgi:hypothetical protein
MRAMPKMRAKIVPETGAKLRMEEREESNFDVTNLKSYSRRGTTGGPAGTGLSASAPANPNIAEGSKR